MVQLFLPGNLKEEGSCLLAPFVFIFALPLRAKKPEQLLSQVVTRGQKREERLFEVTCFNFGAFHASAHTRDYTRNWGSCTPSDVPSCSDEKCLLRGKSRNWVRFWRHPLPHTANRDLVLRVSENQEERKPINIYDVAL